MIPNKAANNPKKINLHNIINFLVAYYRKYIGVKFIKKVPTMNILELYSSNPSKSQQVIVDLHNNEGIPYVERVVMIRELLVSENSPACLAMREGGPSCVECGCPTPDKFYETDPCSYGCYKKWPNENT
jgi:hypothetical protein